MYKEDQLLMRYCDNCHKMTAHRVSHVEQSLRSNLRQVTFTCCRCNHTIVTRPL